LRAVFWSTVSLLIWFGLGWLVYTRAIEGERRLAGVRLSHGTQRLWMSLVGSLTGGALVAALLFVGHVFVLPEVFSSNSSDVYSSLFAPQVGWKIFVFTLVAVLGLSFMRLRWLRPSVLWTLMSAASALHFFPLYPLREGATVFILSSLLLVEAAFFFVFPLGLARPYVFRNSRGGAVTAFVAEGVFALPLLIPAVWVTTPFVSWEFVGNSWVLWPVALPWVMQVRAAHKSLDAELRIRAGITAVGALLSPVLFFLPTEGTRATAMVALVAILISCEEVRERAVGRAVTSPWQEGKEATIVAVVDGSPAAELGIRAGMRIVSVNGTPVRSTQEAYAALYGRPAYVKLELKDQDGEVFFRERGRYEGELPLLGLVFAPRRFDPQRSAPPPEHLIALLRGFPPVSRGEAAVDASRAWEDSPVAGSPPTLLQEVQATSGDIISEERGG